MPNPKVGLFSAIFATPACMAAYGVSAIVANEWGNPKPFTRTINSIGLKGTILLGDITKYTHTIQQTPDQTFWIMPKEKVANDESAVMVYSARKIYEHGGYFCTTQLQSRNKGNKTTRIWTTYKNPVGNVDATCFTLCEPGYTGDTCTRGRATAAQCRYTRLSPETMTDGISYEPHTDTGSVEVPMQQNGGFFYQDPGINATTTGEQDVILAAKSFLENGHGIVASPAAVNAHRGYWNAADYSDTWFTRSDHSNISITANGGNYKTKILCMPGFDGPDCSTTVCDECEDPLTKYNQETGACTDCIENYIHGAGGVCVKCGDNEYAWKDKCMSCKKTEYFDNGQCLPRKGIMADTLRRCWPNIEPTEFAACVSDTCDGSIEKVKCIAGQNTIGTKTCTGGKWGECVRDKKN